MAKRHVTRAKRIIGIYKKLPDALYDHLHEELFVSLTDALTDLRHYCDANNIAFSEADRIAYQHYLAEKQQEKENAT